MEVIWSKTDKSIFINLHTLKILHNVMHIHTFVCSSNAYVPEWRELRIMLGKTESVDILNHCVHI